MNDVLLIAEADGQIGFGHLAELRAVASALRARGVHALQIGVGPVVNGEPDVEWLPDFDAVAAKILVSRPSIVAWSVRTARWRAMWPRLAPVAARHLWIADVADTLPAVDALVIPTLEPPSSSLPLAARLFSGPMYFPLDQRGSRDVPPMAARSRDVLLTLGGADRTEASLRIVPALAGTRSMVVIGPAFKHRHEVQQLAESLGVSAAITPAGLRDLLLQHRIVISAGGNTLFEAAAAGTPALVAWEDPHEETQGRAFEAKGSARVLGRGVDLDAATVQREIRNLLVSASELEAMSAAGRSLIDGRGADRIAELVLDLANGAAA